MSVAEPDVLFLLNQIGFVVSHPTTGDTVLKAAQTALRDGLNPELATPAILESVDLILKHCAAAQVAATFIPAPFDPAVYQKPEPPPEELPPETEEPPPVEEPPPEEPPVEEPPPEGQY